MIEQAITTVTEALISLEPIINFDMAEEGFLRMQIISSGFVGMSYHERMVLVTNLMDQNCPQIFNRYRVRIEVYTPTAWASLPAEMRSYMDPEPEEGVGIA